MDRDAIQRAFDDVFDQALIFHGFTDYMRDYEVITYAAADPRTGIAPSFDRYVFSCCVQANVRSAVAPDTWRRSLDERLLDHEAGKDLDGFVWGVKWQVLYPGMQLLGESETANRWSQNVGLTFHEAVIEANGPRPPRRRRDARPSHVGPARLRVHRGSGLIEGLGRYPGTTLRRPSGPVPEPIIGTSQPERIETFGRSRWISPQSVCAGEEML